MPWRPTPDRVPAFQRCSRYWEQHGHTVIQADSNPDKPFNRSQARNNAVRQATSDVIILADADILPARIDILGQATIIAADLDTAVWPYHTYRLLSADAVTAPKLSRVRPVRQFPAKWRPGGLTVITRRAYQRVGGYDENFGAGWGYEDGAFLLACETLLTVHHLRGVLYAFDHPGDRVRDRANRRRYTIYQRAQNNPEHMRRLTGAKQWI